MSSGHTELFRFVSVRGPERGYTIDPTDDVPGSTVLERISSAPVGTDGPRRELARLLQDVQVLSESDSDGLGIAAAEAAIGHAATLLEWQRTRIEVPAGEGGPGTVEQFASTPEFRAEYHTLVDSWLKLKLTDPADGTVSRHEELIRVAHLLHAVHHDSAALLEPGVAARIMQARVVTPRAWRSSSRREAAVGARHRATLDAMTPVRESPQSKAIAQARRDHADLTRSIDRTENIQAKAHRAYFDWKRRRFSGRPLRRARLVGATGLLRRAVDAVVGRGLGAPESHTLPRVPLDQRYFGELEGLLTRDELAIFRDRLSTVSLPDKLDDLLVVFDPGLSIAQANGVCRQIRIWEEQERERLPTVASSPKSSERPLVRSVGWGDLVVARERLIGYDAHEIAHIENVMPGEAKAREHERQRTVEQITELENFVETESERDLHTTDRYELRSESQATIQEDFSVVAGVNTSGRYGLTKVETSLQAGFQRSKSEARSSGQELSREVISRAVERTLERVYELRRVTSTEQFRELNTHRLENLSDGGVPPTSISGIYLWVEKRLQVELRHYGTRLLVEFYIPEPAVSLLEDRPPPDAPRKPAPFTLSPADVHPGNYLCLTDLFGAEDVQPPPTQYISIGWAWASTPDEAVDENKAEDTVAASIAIPDGYRPVDGYALVSAHPVKAEHVDVFLAVGGVEVINLVGTADGHGEVEFDPALPWPRGVPVSVRAFGHFDKTLVAQVVLRCGRTAEALATWQLRTWELLRAAHDRRTQDYQRAIEELAIRDPFGGPSLGRADAENRRIELVELRKWAIKAMRLAQFNFHAVEQVGDFQEVDPVEGDLQAAIAGLFEAGLEWEQASYFLHPYYWSRRDTWRLRWNADAGDLRHEDFLRAGSARFVVPVTPGYESRVLRYLESDPDVNELDRLNSSADDAMPSDSVFEDLWLELLLDRRPELALGSGTVSVQSGSSTLVINDDSNWRSSERDLGRELYIDGREYTIVATNSQQEVELDRPYEGSTNSTAVYAAGSIPYGPPWVVRVPTSVVILADRQAELGLLGS